MKNMKHKEIKCLAYGFVPAQSGCCGKGILLRVTKAVMKHIDQNQLGEGRVCLETLLHYCSSWKENRAGIQTGQGPGAGANEKAMYKCSLLG